MKCDLHIHTSISEDSTENFENYCKRALALGVDCICYTDHIDNNPMDLGYGFYRSDRYFDGVEAMRQKYSDRLIILAGAEFSEPHVYPREFDACRARPYDFIIGSVHYWYKDLFPSVMVQKGVSLEDCYAHYWEEIRRAVAFGGFDALGHMDFPKRYYRGLLYDEACVAEIFSLMVRNGIVPEVNTSSLRKGLDTAMPDERFLQIYAACGGKYYTTGSDAHFACDLYADIDTEKRRAERLGLRDVIFVGRSMVVQENAE